MGTALPSLLDFIALQAWPLVVLYYDPLFWCHPDYVPSGHACVLTPDGKLLDLKGFFTAREFAEADGEPECVMDLVTAAQLEVRYLMLDEFSNALTESDDYEGADPRENLELAIPLARAILDRYCGWWNTYIPVQLPLFASKGSDAPVLDANNLDPSQSFQAA